MVNLLKDRLRAARESSGLKQKEAAEIIGVSKISLNRWEAGTREPSATNLSQLANLYDCELTWLISNQGEMRREKHSDPEIEMIVRESGADGYECKGGEFSETEKRIIGMLRRLTPEVRQMHFDGITDSYFLQMERDAEKK